MKIAVILLPLLYLVAHISNVQAACSKKFGGCDRRNGLCWDTDSGRNYCTCKSGYNFQVPATRRGKCVDINECKSGLHSCDTKRGRCINTIGSHRCVCKRGYVLDYTRTKCLKAKHIKGTCKRRRTCRRRRYGKRIYGRRCNRSVNRCRCEPGFELRRGCNLCQDINECRRRISLCDLRRGRCHNSDGGYYCSCKTGYVLGPCGFKCYRPKERPSECTFSLTKSASLVSGDSDGLNDEITKSQLLNYITEKASRSRRRRKSLAPIKSVIFQQCRKKKAKVIQKLDLNHDKKTDLTVTYACGADGIYHEKSAYDQEAYWTPWTCWTACKPTCSGGIQTRSRICRNGLVGEGKCRGGATQFKECYTGKKCATKVRREAHSLSTAQKKDLIQAMRKYKADTSTFGFHNAAGTHVFPSQCMGTDGEKAACCYHGAKLNFAIWHRAELLNFEEGLSRHLKDKTLGLPYWDWLRYPNPPPLVWSRKIYGAANPFASMVVRYDLPNKPETQRTKTVNAEMVSSSKDSYLNVARKLMSVSTTHEFSEALENAHNSIHGAICSHWNSSCEFAMSNLAYAAFDPIFFFHHTNVDRLFSVFQKSGESGRARRRGRTTWTRQSALEPQENIYHFNEPYQPFRNKTLTPFKKLHRLSSMQDLYYYEQLLGYKYDTLSTPKTAKVVGDEESDDFDAEKAHVPQSTDRLLIAQYERNTRTNVKIRYFIKNKLEGGKDLGKCKTLSDSDDRYMGSLTILGSRGERPWKSRQPTLADASEKLFKSGSTIANLLRRNRISAHTDIQVKACYTPKVACVKNCPNIAKSVVKRIPSPQLLFYPRNVGTDVFKFEWHKSERFPTWEIDVHAVSQWIHFWGKHAKDVYQVSTPKEYRDCDRRKGVKVDCSGACILPEGAHFFISGNKKRCKLGMRLKILAAM